jgi:hypothetical protein
MAEKRRQEGEGRIGGVWVVCLVWEKGWAAATVGAWPAKERHRAARPTHCCEPPGIEHRDLS